MTKAHYFTALPRERSEGGEAHFAGAQPPQRVELRLQLAQRQVGARGAAAHDGRQRARDQLLLVLREQPLQNGRYVSTFTTGFRRAHFQSNKNFIDLLRLL